MLKVLELKQGTDKSTIIVGDFNTLTIDRTAKQKISSDVELNINTQPKRTDIYRTLYLKTSEYTFFPSTNGTYTKIGHILGHDTSLSINLNQPISYKVPSTATMMVSLK